jgi:hypothetical protein
MQLLTGLAARTEHMGQKLYMDSFFSSSALFDDLHTKMVNRCGTVGPNRKWMPKNFKQNDIEKR